MVVHVFLVLFNDQLKSILLGVFASLDVCTAQIVTAIIAPIVLALDAS